MTNTQSRVEEMSLEIGRVLEAGSTAQLEAQKLWGKMQSAESQIW